MTTLQSRMLAVALLALAVLSSACSSPTGPTPVPPSVSQPGEPLTPSMQTVGTINKFILDPYNPSLGPHSGGIGALFTITSGPIKTLLFMDTEASYNLLIKVTVYDAGNLGTILASKTVTFTGKEVQVELLYDSNQCVYKSLANGTLQCMLSVKNLDTEHKVSGRGRIEGIPIR